MLVAIAACLPEIYKVDQCVRLGFWWFRSNYKNSFLQLIPRYEAATLIPILQAIILLGTRIWSDQWVETVNHNIKFVDFVTGCYTNNIEAQI